MNRSKVKTSLAITCAAILLAGCADTPEKLYPVKGTVSVGGRTMNGGTVQFEMIEKGTSGKVYTSSGSIDGNGRYELVTFGEAGAPAGEHRVWVSPNFARMPDKLGVSVERMSPIPKKYMLPTETDLTYSVVEDDNTIDIDVPVK